MVQGGHPDAVFIEKQAVLLGDLEVRTDQLHGGHAPQTHDDLRLHQLRLTPQIAEAGGLFAIQRVAVLGRAALDDVGDIHRLPLQADHGQHVVQELSGRAHEGQTLLVLIGAGAFTDEQHFCVGAACAEDHVLPRVRQGAGTALQTFILQLFPRGHRGFLPIIFFRGHNPPSPVGH